MLKTSSSPDNHTALPGVFHFLSITNGTIADMSNARWLAFLIKNLTVINEAHTKCGKLTISGEKVQFTWHDIENTSLALIALLTEMYH